MKKLEALEKVIVPAILLTLCVALLQRHSFLYWNERIGWGWGAVASLALEAIAFLMLYQSGVWYRAAGLVIGLVLVGVPVYQVAAPEFAAIRAANEARERVIHNRSVAKKEIPEVQAKIAALNASKEKYEKNSETRAGWEPIIRETAAMTARKEARETELKSWRDTPVPPEREWLGVALKNAPLIASMTAFYLAGVWCVLTISNFRHRLKREPEIAETLGMAETDLHSAGANSEKAPPPEMKRPPEPPFHAAPRPEAPPASETVETATGAEAVETFQSVGGNDLLVKRLQLAVKPLVARAGSGNKFCSEYGVNPRDLNWLMRHFARKEAGEQTVSANKLAELAGRFLEGGQSGVSNQ